MCAPQCQILCSHASWFGEKSAFLPCFVSSLRPMPGNSTMSHTEAEKESSQQRGERGEKTRSRQLSRFREYPLIPQSCTEKYSHTDYWDLCGKVSDVLHHTVAESWYWKPIFQAEFVLWL